MASPLTNQTVNDLKQNFFWSYISQYQANVEVTNLEITVEDLLEYINIDLGGDDPYNPEDLATLYYGINTKISVPGLKYFTYLLSNSEINGLGEIVNLGIIGYPYEFLLLKENTVSLAVNNTEYNTRTGMYKDAAIYSPFTSQSSVIGSFANHPLTCSFPKEDFRNFIRDNMSSPTMDLSALTLVFQMGATFVTGVDSDYQVQTGIVVTKDGGGIRLDAINYQDKPFKFKAMDVGKLCPPQCDN